MTQLLCEELTTEKWAPVSCGGVGVNGGSSLVAAYDEHVLVNHFKFGLLHQRRGQTTEEDIFANNGTSPALDEFLHLLGDRINLLHHKGYHLLFHHLFHHLFHLLLHLLVEFLNRILKESRMFQSNLRILWNFWDLLGFFNQIYGFFYHI